ncbi:MAG: ATP cone domain-containing protein [Planctomycetota bacterium]
MIQVLKRDGAVEPFCVDRLRACLRRVLRPTGQADTLPRLLCEAIAIHLRRRGTAKVSSAALFEMVLLALRETDQPSAGDALEAHRRWRHRARRALRLVDEDGRLRAWDRGWLTGRIQSRWALSRPAARALGAIIEAELLGRPGELSQRRIDDLIDERVENYGLAPWCLIASPSVPSRRSRGI